MNKTLTTTFFVMAVAMGSTIPLLAETYTSASYVKREHMIAQWDGIDNAGTGTHDPTATKWKDLVGTRHLTLQPGGSWSAAGNALVVNGKSAEYNGTVHHSLFKGLDGQWRIAFHAHCGEGRVYPRTTYIASLIVGGTPDAPKLSVGGELVKCVVVE